jgi:hypothetical protein
MSHALVCEQMNVKSLIHEKSLIRPTIEVNFGSFGNHLSMKNHLSALQSKLTLDLLANTVESPEVIYPHP